MTTTMQKVRDAFPPALTTIQVLELIRDDYAFERNAFIYPPFGEAERYARHVERAQQKLDAVNEAIRFLKTDGNDMKIGARVKLVEDVDNYPDIFAPAGLTGTLVRVDDDEGFCWVQLDKHFDELNEWDNRLQVRDWSALRPE